MLDQIDLTYFKCFERLVLPLRPLTLLSGANAAGKSSILQALVLLHQTMREQEWSRRLMLNGNELQLGTVVEVVDQENGRRSLSIGLAAGGIKLQWSFSYEDRQEMSFQVESVRIGERPYSEPTELRHLIPRTAYEEVATLATQLCNLTYITAERVGPRDMYPLADWQSAAVVGPRGEHTASVLYRGRDETVTSTMLIADFSPRRFVQIEEWMRYFFPGCGIEVELVPKTNQIKLGLRTSASTAHHRPVHVGFGLTQVLPIVVAALSAQQGDLLLIENPEVHLHPSGQARMGVFLAKLAASGVQVILETHSDHVLNGIRRAVRAGTLAPTDAALHFFRPRIRDQAQVLSPVMDGRGNLDIWPEGFFDQFDKDMLHFAGWEE